MLVMVLVWWLRSWRVDFLIFDVNFEWDYGNNKI